MLQSTQIRIFATLIVLLMLELPFTSTHVAAQPTSASDKTMPLDSDPHQDTTVRAQTQVFTLIGYSYRWLDNTSLNSALTSGGFGAANSGVLDIYYSSMIHFAGGFILKSDFAAGILPISRKTEGNMALTTTILQGSASFNIGYNFIASESFRLYATAGLETQLWFLNLVKRPIEPDFVQSLRSNEPEVTRSYWIARLNVPIMICTDFKAFTLNLTNFNQQNISIAYYIHVALGYSIGLFDPMPITSQVQAPVFPSSGPIVRFALGFNNTDILRQIEERRKSTHSSMP